MRSPEYYTKATREAIKEGLVDHEKGDKSKSELLDDVLNIKGKYNKMVAAVSLINEIMPNSLSESMVRKLDKRDYSKLPFKEEFELKEKVGRGSMSKVFLLESKDENTPSFALKFGYRDVGGLEELQQIAKSNQECYKKVCELYKEMPDLIPKEASLILTARKNRKPAVVTVQRFLGRNLKDLFNDYSKDELINFLKNNPRLQADFIKFTDISFKMKNEQGLVVDLLGDKNLSIAKDKDGFKLVMLDPHHISNIKIDDKERKERLRKCLDYLKEVCDKIGEFEYAEAA